MSAGVGIFSPDQTGSLLKPCPAEGGLGSICLMTAEIMESSP